MAAHAKGEVVRNPTRDGFTFALRFTASGKRRYVTLGAPAEGWTQARAEAEAPGERRDWEAEPELVRPSRGASTGRHRGRSSR